MSTTYQGSKKQLPGVPKLHVQVNNHLSQSVVSGLGHDKWNGLVSEHIKKLDLNKVKEYEKKR